MSSTTRRKLSPASARSFPAALREIRSEVDGRLKALTAVRPVDHFDRATSAALTSGGKRLRAVLVCLVAHSGGRPLTEAADVGVAIEMIHAASLVLDDLPCMDDAMLRRGRPTLHREFGEATAILVAFALLSAAQTRLPEALARLGVAPAHRESLARRQSEVVTSLCRGQVADLGLNEAQAELEVLEQIHAQKTGALFEFAAEVGAAVGGLSTTGRNATMAFARNLGLAFQVGDDILDAVGDPGTTGKDSGRDRQLRRTTFVSAVGQAGAMTIRDELIAAAVEALAPLGPKAGLLHAMADHVRDRTS